MNDFLIKLMDIYAIGAAGILAALTIISFPFYAIRFGNHLFKRQYHRLQHLTMILFIMAFINAIFFAGPCVVTHFFGFPLPWHREEAEVKIYMHVLHFMQKAYFAEYGAYAQGPSCFENLGWAPEGDTRHTYICEDDTIPSIHLCSKSVPCPDPPVEADFSYLSVKAATSEKGFTMLAVGNLDRDPSLDVWMVNDAKELIHLSKDWDHDYRPIFKNSPPIEIVKFYLRENTPYPYVLDLLAPLLIASLIRDARSGRKQRIEPLAKGPM